MIAVDKPKRTRLRRDDDDRLLVSQVVVAVVMQGRTACAELRAVMTVKESSTSSTWSFTAAGDLCFFPSSVVALQLSSLE
jgi:hypothetical protein